MPAVNTSVSLPPLTAVPDSFRLASDVIGSFGTDTAALFMQQLPSYEFQPLGQLLP